MLLVWQSYVSILYLRMPPGFRILLRGQEVHHHNLVDDLMYTQELTYRPQSGADHVTRETDVSDWSWIFCPFSMDAMFLVCWLLSWKPKCAAIDSNVEDPFSLDCV